MKTNLERLLDGEEATYKLGKVIQVVETKRKKKDCILIIDEDGVFWFSKEDINRPDFYTFTNPPKQRTIEDGLKYGDEVDLGGDVSRVIGVCGDVVFIDDFCPDWSTLSEMINDGYKLIQPESKKDWKSELLEETKKFAIHHNLHYDELTESMIENAINYTIEKCK